MTREKKKPYVKPELKTRQMEMGVLGDYGNAGGQTITPTTPIRQPDRRGGTGLDG
ncbi:MAG: hypothetical protein ABIF77_17055 [bacterium]